MKIRDQLKFELPAIIRQNIICEIISRGFLFQRFKFNFQLYKSAITDYSTVQYVLKQTITGHRKSDLNNYF
jgi:hypothetical protein